MKDKVFQIQCVGCGAVFTSETENVPACLQCLCNGKEFKLLERQN